MKILVIPTWYPMGADKLMGQYHKEFTEALNKYGIEANILYIYRMRLKSPLKYLKEKKKRIIQENGYKTYIYKLYNINKFGNKYMIKRYVKKLEYALDDYIKENGKPDIIHAMVSSPAGYASCVVSKKYSIPVVITEHGGALERFFTRKDLKEYGLYALNNSTYSTVSKYMMEIVKKYKNECFVLPNLVNTNIFNPNIERKIDKTFNLATVCALREGKNLDVAFRAIKKLIDDGMNIHYDVVGDGYYEDIYKKAAKEEGVNDYVTFWGRKSKEEISKIFDTVHALIISSELESFAIPGIEAMAAGLPVISTDCKGPSEYIDSKTGIICKVNDSADMANAIKYVYENYKKYDKKDLVNRASQYDESHVVKIAQNIYDVALKNSGKKIY